MNKTLIAAIILVALTAAGVATAVVGAVQNNEPVMWVGIIAASAANLAAGVVKLATRTENRQ